MDGDVARLRTGPHRRHVAEVVFAVLAGVWIIAATFGIQTLTWAVEQFLIVEGLAMPAWAWPLAVCVNAALIGVPALVLALLARRPAVRATARAATLAALALGVLGSLRGLPSEQTELYLGALALVAALCALVIRATSRNRLPETNAGTGVGSGRFLLATAAGVAIGIPWLWVGALGSRLETGLALLAAAASGWLAAELLAPALSTFPSGLGGRLLAGFATGTVLVPLAAGIGGSGPNLAELAILPALGFAAAALCPWVPSRIAIGLLTGTAAVGPLAFVEPDQTTVALGFHDVGYWALIGTLCSLGIALLISVALLIGVTYLVETAIPAAGAWRRAVAPVVLVAVVATALVVYPTAGHPGFFGGRLFVVMKTQADLTGLAQITNLTERRRETYQRLVDVAEVSQAPLRRVLRRDGLAFTPYYLVNGIVVDAGPDTRIWLSRRSDVDRVLLDPHLRPIPSAGGPLRGDRPAPSGPEWNISMIGADTVWATGDTGTGIVIGGSDTGVDVNHPALAASYRGGDDSWFDPWNHTRAPVDHNGHGTHTMGSALGAGGIGVAPGAQWMSCVNLDRDMGNPGYYLDCLQFMLAPFPYGGDPFRDGRPDRAADVLTNSWGCPALEGCDESALAPAVAALTAAGIFFVAAAGNEGPRCSSIDDAPAPYPDTFTVGATDRSGRVADFSSRGPVPGPDRGATKDLGSTTDGGVTKPDVVAPGVGVVSALPGGGYGSLDGTSMATPQVAGVVALMWSASPALRGDVTRTAEILRDTAVPATSSRLTLGTGTCDGVDQTGAGLVNAIAAVLVARNSH